MSKQDMLDENIDVSPDNNQLEKLIEEETPVEEAEEALEDLEDTIEKEIVHMGITIDEGDGGDPSKEYAYKEIAKEKKNQEFGPIPFETDYRGPEIADPSTPVTIEKFDDLHEKVKEKYGDMLFIEDLDAIGVEEQLMSLDKLPPKLINYLKRANVKIKLITTPPENVPDFYYQIGKSNWNIRSIYGYGFWSPHERTCYATSPLDTISETNAIIGEATDVVLHEIGHACHDTLPLDLKTLKESHVRLYHKLGWYYRQEGPGGVTGLKEFYAESFSKYFNSTKEEFIYYYDEEWYNEMHKIVNRDYDKISKYDHDPNKPDDLIKVPKPPYRSQITQEKLNEM